MLLEADGRRTPLPNESYCKHDDLQEHDDMNSIYFKKVLYLYNKAARYQSGLGVRLGAGRCERSSMSCTTFSADSEHVTYVDSYLP
jgi:hypothetical protein